MRVLVGDGDAPRLMSRPHAAAAMPTHDHDHDAECLVIAGDLVTEVGRPGLGDFRLPGRDGRHAAMHCPKRGGFTSARTGGDAPVFTPRVSCRFRNVIARSGPTMTQP
jgi:anti-sigma factor ChrR (cupin superfamily)